MTKSKGSLMMLRETPFKRVHPLVESTFVAPRRRRREERMLSWSSPLHHERMLSWSSPLHHHDDDERRGWPRGEDRGCRGR
jgi:hypothetical protein